MISKYGSVIRSQTTDMTQQIDDNHQNKKPIGLVTDSMSGLDPDFTLKHDIIVVPFKTSWKKVDAQIADPNISVYQKMRLFENKTKEVGWPKTSQPSPKDYLTAFKEQLQKYNSVICIPTSSSISGSFNCALQARSFLPSNDQNKIFISDFLQVGPGQAILIIKAIQLIKQGYSPQQIENELFVVSQKETVFATPENMNWIIKGGRVSGFKAKILYFLKNLNFHPTFYLTAKGVSIMKVYFGHKDVYSLMTRDLKQIAQKADTNNLPLKIIIQHSCDQSKIEDFEKSLDPQLFQILQTSTLSPVLGTHVGPGTIGIALLSQKI
jgi:DegV family protein with EDD domain